MKRKPISWVTYTLAFSLFAVAGCQKIDWDDVWHKHNPDCQVKKIKYFLDFAPDSITAVYNYNKHGQPTTIVYDYISTGRPNIVFRYDHKGRMTDFIAPYDNENYEVWYKYKYDNSGRIVSDTQFVFGSYIDSVPSPDFSYQQRPGFYEYDVWGRITKETRHYPENIVEEWEYVYNGDGNLSAINEVVNGHRGGTRTFTTYDNKVSILRTNPIWMFLERNYSKNNMIAADQYNSKGLPTKFRSAIPGRYHFLHETDISRSDIEYQCK
jgi:hypothetical protein